MSILCRFWSLLFTPRSSFEKHEDLHVQSRWEQQRVNGSGILLVHVLNGDVEVEIVRYLSFECANPPRAPELRSVLDEYHNYTGSIFVKNSDETKVEISDEYEIYETFVYFQLDSKCAAMVTRRNFRKNTKVLKLQFAQVEWKETLQDYERFNREEEHCVGE